MDVKISADITEARKAHGYALEMPLIASREGRTWHVYAGISDEYSAHGSTLLIALKRLAKTLNITDGTIRIGDDRTFSEQRYDMTGKPVNKVKSITASVERVRAIQDASDSPASQESAKYAAPQDTQESENSANEITPGNQGMGTASRLDADALVSIFSEYGTPDGVLPTRPGLRTVTPFSAASSAIRAARRELPTMTDAEYAASENLAGAETEPSVPELVTVFVDCHGRAVADLEIYRDDLPSVAACLTAYGYAVSYDLY